jgi:hypothetical protein
MGDGGKVEGTRQEATKECTQVEQQHLRRGMKGLTRRDSDGVGYIEADNAGCRVLGAQALSRAAHKTDTPTPVKRAAHETRDHKRD